MSMIRLGAREEEEDVFVEAMGGGGGGGNRMGLMENVLTSNLKKYAYSKAQATDRSNVINIRTKNSLPNSTLNPI